MWIGNQTIFAELGLADVQNAFDEIDIGPVEAARFARTQAGTGQQSDEDRQHRASLGVSW